MEMTTEEYYTAPPPHVFDEIKRASISIWNGYESPYKEDKLNRICDLENVRDNAWYMVAMFDQNNQTKLLGMVSSETEELIRRARGY